MTSVSYSRIDGLIPPAGARFRALQDRLHDMGTGVPHEAANIPCGAFIGQRVSDGVVWNQYCKKRVGHTQPKAEKKHIAVDFRMVASPHRVVHTERFKPNTLPAGIDLSTTTPHDCENHLADVLDLQTEAFRRGR
jgi:hypothetical protein